MTKLTKFIKEMKKYEQVDTEVNKKMSRLEKKIDKCR